SQVVAASAAHFFVKLVKAAPESFLASAWLLQVPSATAGLAANTRSAIAISARIFISPLLFQE
ncbi:hypothetical protein, partial [Klebsiella pneumoniae]|uniref:hypothetical protein n=1 Tax=Klebsiella pneumoniae TaxID=573 RepID=UPI001952CB82